MTFLRVVLLTLLTAFTVMGQQKPSEAPASCPITAPPTNPFTPPAPYQLEGNDTFWIGTEKLWTARSTSEVWTSVPRKPGHEREVQPLTVKTFWASVDFDWRKEWPVTMTVTGRRLDGNAPSLLTMRATNAMVPGPTPTMLVGVYVPTPGCWEITGHYKGQDLSFVVWVSLWRRTK